MIGALGRIGALALALLIGVPAPTAALDAPGSAADTAEPTPGSETASNRPADLGGRWRELPRSPFAAVSPVAVWANDHMVAIDPRTGRTATYDPPMRRWEEHQPLPSEPDSPTRSFEGVTGAVAAGGEVIARALYVGPDDDWYAWYAFDPLAGRWRDVAASPFERNVGGLPAWTGDLLVMVAEDRSAAAYVPAADRWLEMPPAPLPELPENAFTARVAEWSPRSLHWTGEALLAVMVRDAAPPLDRIGIVSFDPTTWAWTSRSLGPIERSSADPIFVEGSLWFMSGEPNDRYITNATYDPATDTWTELEARCPLGTHRATWTGERIMEPYWDRRAFDPATGECFRIPASGDRARGSVPVWTGREFLYWSGAYGDTSRARRDGIAYRPPLEAITGEEAKPVGKKLERAIESRLRFGFDADPELVREIMRDPWKPGSREFGFPMTEEEYWDLNDRSWFSSETKKEVVPYVKRRPIKGGWWVDHRHGGRLGVALTEADPDVIARIDSLMPTEPDLGWRLVIVERPLKELRAAQWRAPRVSERLDPAAKLWSWGVDVRDGVVTLMYDPDDVKRMRVRKKQLENRLGVPVRITSGRVGDL